MGIYLDHNATTPVDPAVLEAMLPYFGERFGNPSSRSHRWGWEAEEAVEQARAEVASLLGASPKEVVFTSGATESNNLALLGAMAAYRERGNHLVTTAIEHPAVLDVARRLEKRGVELTVVPVGRSGIVDPDDVRRALRPDTVLVSVMAANNEIGTLQPLADVAAAAATSGALVHTDAAQAAGKVPLDPGRTGIDLLSLSAHKLYGPKGVGALWIRRRARDGRPLRLEPLVAGGGQERGLRPGTLNVPGIVGLGKACAIARVALAEEARRLRALRDRLLATLERELEEVRVNGDLERRLPGNLSVSFAWIEGEALVTGLKDVAVSLGSACTSGSKEPSHVLRAIGLRDELAHATVRFGIGRFNTEAEIDRAAAELVRAVRRLREMSPLAEAARGPGARREA